MTTVEVAKMLKIRPQTLRKMRMRGLGPKFFIRKEMTGKYHQVRYDRAEVEKWMRTLGNDE